MAQSDRGATTVEWALNVAIIAVALIAGVKGFTVGLADRWCRNFQAFDSDAINLNYSFERMRGAWYCFHMREGAIVDDEFRLYW